MMSLRRTVAALACLPLIVLAACGDDDSEADEPGTPTPSASPSATPSPTESETPEPDPTAYPADEFTAEEFVRAWIEAYGEASVTGDTDRVRQMSGDACATCNSIVGNLEQTYAQGGRIEVVGQPVQVVSVGLPEEPVEGVTVVTVKVRFNGGTNQADDDSEPVEFPTETYEWDVYLGLVEGRWTATEISI